MKSLLIFFILSTCCSAACSSQGHDSLFIASAIQQLENSRDYTLKIADMVDGDHYGFRPTPEAMSFGEQLIHLSYNLGWLSSSYLSSGEHPINEDDKRLQDKDSIRVVVARTYDHAIAVMQNFDRRNLGDTVKFFAGPMTKMQIINLMSDHQTHHRGQVLVYLRLCGYTPPRYVGW